MPANLIRNKGALKKQQIVNGDTNETKNLRIKYQSGTKDHNRFIIGMMKDYGQKKRVIIKMMSIMDRKKYFKKFLI